MSGLEIIIEGADPQPAAAELVALVQGFGADAAVSTPDAASDEARRAVDPIALTALIVAIPPGVLAVLQLGDRIADRLEKRRRAKQLLERARQIRTTRKVEFHVVGKDGSRQLLTLTEDEVLDLAEAKERDASDNP